MATQNLIELSDAELLAQIQNGDDDAIDALMLKYERLLRAIITHKGITNPDDVNDVFGDICYAFVKQAREAPTAIREVDKWLKQVARNKCADFGRAIQRRQQTLEVAADLRRAAVDWEARRGLPSDPRAAALLEILKELGPKYVAVAKLWAEYTSAEIGEMLGIPENTVKSRKRKIRQRLAEALRDLSPPEKQS